MPIEASRAGRQGRHASDIGRQEDLGYRQSPAEFGFDLSHQFVEQHQAAHLNLKRHPPWRITHLQHLSCMPKLVRG